MRTKIYLCLVALLTLLTACQSDEETSRLDEMVNISFDMTDEFTVEEGLMTRSVSTYDYYYIAVSSETEAEGTISNGYAGYFTSLSGVSLSLPKGTYNFYISAYKSTGYAINWQNVNSGLVQGQFVKVLGATEYAPAFADEKVDRYYGSVSKEITTNTTVKVEGMRFAYGINVDIEKPLDGKVVLSCTSPAFSYTISSTGSAVKESNIFSMAGTDPATASKTMNVTMTLYDASNAVVKTQTKSITVERNYYKTFKIKALDPKVSFEFSTFDGDMSDGGGAEIDKTLPEQEAVHEYVDLGLSVKWATMNVGASSPEEYGNYYAWGETTTKSTYDWSTYKWRNGSSDTQTKYNTFSSYGTVDNKTTLDLADDAAYVNWGENWRMPTHAEMQELRENCTWTWTTQNGKNGYKVTSEKDTSKSIFLPAAGYRDDSSLGDDCGDGYYWSSSLYESRPYNACYSILTSQKFDPDYDYYRCCGFSIRPVRRQ